jgi:cystathionine beta-lyase
MPNILHVGASGALLSMVNAVFLSPVQNAEGTALGPFDCWLLLRGVKTMALRMERQVGASSAGQGKMS